MNSETLVKTPKIPFNCIYKKAKEYIHLCSDHNMCNGLVIATYAGSFYYVVNKNKHKEKEAEVENNEGNT